MKKWLALFLCLCITPCAAFAAEFDGAVVAGETVSVYAPYGGVISHSSLRQGELLHIGDEIAQIKTTRVLATEDGTIRGVFAKEGDSAGATVLYLAPVSKFTITCSIENAYDSAATKYVTIGENVYIKCSQDGSHRAQGVITAVSGSDYTVQTTAGELYMEENVYLYRTPEYKSAQRIGSGKVNRTDAIAVSGTGSILHMHVQDGEEVERGQLLFETVEGDIDALVSTDNIIRSTVSGVVAEVKAAAGQRVNKNDVLLTVYRTQDYQIRFSIPEEELSSVQAGDSAKLYFSWNEDKSMPLEGTVTEVSYMSEETEAGVTYSGYISFTPDESVRLGMNVSVVVEEEDE